MTAEPPIDTRTHRVLAGASRVRVLEFLRAAWPEPVAAAELAERMGLHPNTVRLHLDQLIGAGLAERRTEHRSGPGRPRLLFAARPHGTASREESAGGGDVEGYKTLAGILAGQLARPGAGGPSGAVDAGRAWGHSLPAAWRSPATAPGQRPTGDALAGPGVAGQGGTADEATGLLVQLMDRLGFAPSLPAPGGPVELHRCPFSDVAAEQPEVVCGVHLGLMEAVLEDLDAPLHAARLEPFAAPGVCRAHLSPRARPGGDADGPAPVLAVGSRPPVAPPPPRP